MRKISTLLILFAVSNLTFISCDSDEQTPVNETDSSSVVASMTIDAVNALDLQTGIQTTTENTASGKNSTSYNETCATISLDNASGYPKTFTVDYGNGCTIGQIIRKGKLEITISAPIIQTGSIMTIERLDYSINNLKFEGTITYVNKTTNDLVPQWTRTVTNGKFTNYFGQVFTNSGSYTVQKTAGVETPFLLSDDIYGIIEGQHIVTDETGETLTLTVLETLIKKSNCDFISKGKITIKGGLLNGVVDYGNNDCDNNYTYTHENGMVYNLMM